MRLALPALVAGIGVGGFLAPAATCLERDPVAGDVESAWQGAVVRELG